MPIPGSKLICTYLCCSMSTIQGQMRQWIWTKAVALCLYVRAYLASMAKDGKQEENMSRNTRHMCDSGLLVLRPTLIINHSGFWQLLKLTILKNHWRKHPSSQRGRMQGYISPWGKFSKSLQTITVYDLKKYVDTFVQFTVIFVTC